MKKYLVWVSSFGILLSAALTPSVATEKETMEVVGTGDGLDILRALASDYAQVNRDSEVSIPRSIGSGGGIAAVGSGKNVLGRVARALTDAEREAGIVYKPIVRLPSAFFVHPTARVEQISNAQLNGIYSGEITNWKEVGGADLRIRVIRREDIDSTLVVLRASMPGWKDLKITERSKIATSTQEAIDSAREVPGAIGFAPYSKSLDQGLVVLKIDGKHPVDDGYPSNNELALIHLDKMNSPLASSFINYVFSERAQEIVRQFGAIPVANKKR